MSSRVFLAEVKTTANLQHPNILPLFDSGEADGLLFYVMPYMEGESLRQRLNREHHLPVSDAVQVNSGSFCQFLAIRGTAFNSVSSVSLHNLSYTPGVAYRMVMTMDVDAGTISATQDGAPVTVSRTNFPYMPIRFGLESCTMAAQESAADNFRIEHRWP